MALAVRSEAHFSRCLGVRRYRRWSVDCPGRRWGSLVVADGDALWSPVDLCFAVGSIGPDRDADSAFADMAAAGRRGRSPRPGDGIVRALGKTQRERPTDHPRADLQCAR